MICFIKNFIKASFLGCLLISMASMGYAMDQLGEKYDNSGKNEINNKNNKSNKSNILIFISFSMPQNSIKGWLEEGEKIGAPVMIRGLVNNSFKDTTQKIGELTQNNRGGMQLDPTLFQKYHIDKVPAIVVTSDSNCLPNQSCREEYDVIYGDITLEYALGEIANKNDGLSTIAKAALIKLQNEQNTQNKQNKTEAI